MTTLAEQLTTAVTQAVTDSGLLNDIVHGPSSGDGSLVTTDGGDVKSVSRIISEIGDTSAQALKDLSNVAGADFLAKAVAEVAAADIGAAATSHTHVLANITDAGTAAALDSGTGAGEVPVLDGSARLPAVDGSQLTGVRDNGSRDLAASAMAYAMATNDSTSITGTVGSFLLVDDFEADSLDVNTNGTYSADDDSYGNPGAVAVDTSGTASSAYGGTPANANDDDNGTSWTGTLINFSGAGDSAKRLLIVEFSSSKDISEIIVDQISTATGSGSFKLQTSSDGISYSDYGTGFTVTSTPASYTRTVDVPASYVAIVYAGSGDYSGTGITVRDLEISTAGAATDVVWRPDAVTLETADPDDLAGRFVFNIIDAVTFGTDVIGKYSIDGGSTWATGSWEKIGVIGSDGLELWRLDADVSGQSGSSLLWEVSTANNKRIDLVSTPGTEVFY